MSTTDDIYEKSIRPLPASERLRLATRILNDLRPEGIADYGDDWTDDDRREISQLSLQQAAASFGEEPEVA
ncbi:MAG: hypothetical protein ACYCW6_31110 [Candidatus Xenobia bacterium]